VAAERPPHAEELRRAGVPAGRLSVLPSPAGGLGRLPSQNEARTRLSLPDDAPIVLCVTRLPLRGQGEEWGKTEGVGDLLASFSTLPAECLLLVVGGGEGRSWVEEEITRLGIGPRVRLVGSVPHEEVGWFYAACDLYAYPFSEDRPFVAIVEAQAAGRPVVAMRSPSTETIVADGQSGLLADDLKEFETHLAALAADRAWCASMGQAAGDYVATHHSIETRVKQIEALLLGQGDEARYPMQA
jgi:1,2-diacylglycerol 3-alpha-glucosyltransferase